MPQEPLYKDIGNPVEDQGVLLKTIESASFGENRWQFDYCLRRHACRKDTMSKEVHAQPYRKR